MSNLHNDHRKRLKAEFRENGLDHFEQHRIVELLLFYAIPRVDTNETAHRLMDRFGSVSGILDAPYELLCEVQGIGPEAGTFLKLLSSFIKIYMDDRLSRDNRITDPDTAKRYMQSKFLGETAECVYLAGIGNNGKVIFCKRMEEGSPESVGIKPSVLIRALLRADAVKAVLAHNHPYGICNPSGADVRATCILHEELARVDVELMDHIVVAADGVSSLREQGMMPKSRR